MDDFKLYQNRLKTARIAGFLYVILALAMFPQMVRDRLIVMSDATTTQQNILANTQLFRLSLFGDLLCYVAFLFLAVCFYSLLKNVGVNAAQSMLGLVLVCIAIAMLSASNELTALSLFQNNNPNQAMIFLGLFSNGLLIAEIFMGLWLFPLGWLFFKSDFMPKTLGILLMIGCFGYLVDSFAGIVMPEWQAWTKNAVIFPAMAELATVFWLLVFGVMRPAKPELHKVAI